MIPPPWRLCAGITCLWLQATPVFETSVEAAMTPVLCTLLARWHCTHTDSLLPELPGHVGTSPGYTGACQSHTWHPGPVVGVSSLMTFELLSGSFSHCPGEELLAVMAYPHESPCRKAHSHSLGILCRPRIFIFYNMDRLRIF